jgi:hypothetical protein
MVPDTRAKPHFTSPTVQVSKCHFVRLRTMNPFLAPDCTSCFVLKRISCLRGRLRATARSVVLNSRYSSPSDNDPDNLAYLGTIEKRIAEDCNAGKHSHLSSGKHVTRLRSGHSRAIAARTQGGKLKYGGFNVVDHTVQLSE